MNSECIGTQTIDNREHALIFSAGDLSIGGALDGNRQATGQAGTLNNARDNRGQTVRRDRRYIQRVKVP